MTPGWRRWAAILTTYICLFAGAIPYRIRVPPPGQLVALSGDDLRVEVDLPPPGGGGGDLVVAIETPDPRSRREGEAEGEVGGGEGARRGGRVRRDGELWIELVDMEMGAEKARRRKEGEERRRKMEEDGAGGVAVEGVSVPKGSGGGGGGRRWRREETGGGGSGGGEGGGSEEGKETMGRREIGGKWNSVVVSTEGDAEEEVEEEENGSGDKKAGGKRYGWVAGGVRPKGERENAVRIGGKEAGAGGSKGGGSKWPGGDGWGGKLRWRSWNGRVAGFGGGSAGKEGGEERARLGAEEAIGPREKKGGGGGRTGEGQRDRGRGDGEASKGEVQEAAAERKELEEEEGEEALGLILETALVSRGWHLPSASPKGSPHTGSSSPPHSTLALTFPASHFTHGGLYVVRLVGTGRVVSNPSTQRPQRDTATTEGAVESREADSATEPLRVDRDRLDEKGKLVVGTETRGANAGSAPGTSDGGWKNISEGAKAEGRFKSGAKDPETGGSLEGRHGTGKTTKDVPPRSDDVNTGGGEVLHTDGGDKDDLKRMYGRILEALENRERWEEYDRGGVPSDRKSPGVVPEEKENGSEMLRGMEEGRASAGRRRRKREEESSGWTQKAAKKRRMGPLPLRGDVPGGARSRDGLLAEVDESAEGPRRGLEWPDGEHSRVSDYGEGFEGEHQVPGQWEGGGWGIGGRVVSKSWEDREGRFLEGGGFDSERGGLRPLEGLSAKPMEDRGGEVSGGKTGAEPSRFLRAYLEKKALEGDVGEGKGKRKGKDGGGKDGSDVEVANSTETRAPWPSGAAGLDHVARSKRRKRNEEGNLFDEPSIYRLTDKNVRGNYGSAIDGRDSFSSLHVRTIQKREVEGTKAEDDSENAKGKVSPESVTDPTSLKVSNSTGTTEGRVSRDVGKGCKENCDTVPSRHILAEENVLVSWPAARFTLNILSSSSTLSSSTSSSKSKSEAPNRNITFDTFEAPVRVLVEIPCGMEGVGRRVRRELVSEEFGDTLHVQGFKDSEKLSAKVLKDEINRLIGVNVDRTSRPGFRTRRSAIISNQKGSETSGGPDTKEIAGAEPSAGEKPKRDKKGARGETERLWKEREWRREGVSGRKERDSKGEKNYEVSPQEWSDAVLPGVDFVTTDRQFAGDGEEAFSPPPETEGPRKVRIRKERVTKYDINDDVLESLEEKAGFLGSSGYAMKREVRDGPVENERQIGVERNRGRERNPVGLENGGTRIRVESWMRGVAKVGGARERRDADGRSEPAQEEEERVKRAPTTAGSSRNPKTGLSPGPPKLPFRVFLVLRYCGVDSTECDEEDAGKGNVEIWRRPQTVFTKELVDFPACPKYQHQVILPCEAFGQAGVYMVQVRSNYTLEEDEVGKMEGRKRREAEEDYGGGKQGVRGRGETVAKPRDSSTVSGIQIDSVANEDDREMGKSSGNSMGESSRRDKTQSNDGLSSIGGEEMRVYEAQRVSENSGAMGMHRKSMALAGDRDPTKESERSEGELSVDRRGGDENIFGGSSGGGAGVFDASAGDDYGEGVGEEPPQPRKRRGSAWEMGGSSWWEFGSGDGDSDDGSGDWGDGGGGWPDTAGKGRREGSGDAEYGDDPESGSGSDPNASSRRKLPDPPPGSLWASSESITVRLSQGYVFTVHARSVFPCSDTHVRHETLEPAPSGVPVLFEYPECILEASDRVRVFGRARPDVAAILPPFWMGTDASTDAAVTLSHPSLRYVAEKKIYKGKHNAWFDCSLFTERFSEYCFAYASEAMTGAVTHVRAQCIPTLPTSEKDRGGWGSWSPWSKCSTTCGSGSRNRYRTCDNPPPRYGAPFCEGAALETERCPPPAGVTYEELQEMCPLGLALNAADDANRKGGEPNCRCGGCVVHLQGVAGSWGSRNAGPIKSRPRLIASSSQACPGRSFWLLQAEPGHVVGLTVSSLLLPCPRRQWLKARDGDSLSSRLILHLPSASTSNGAPAFSTEALCFSSGPHMLVEFYSFERLEATCSGGFLAHAHQVLANSSASAIGRDVLLTPTTRAVSRSSLSVHAAALAFILALLALSGGLALNYVLRRRRFDEELKKREKEDEEMSDSDSDTKCFIARNKDGGSATSVTSVSDVISLRKLSVGKDGKRREVHMRLTEESDEEDDEEEDDEEEERRRGEGGVGKEEEGATKSTDHNEPAKANLPKVEVLHPGHLKGKRSGGERSRRRGRVETTVRGGVRGVVVEEEEEEEEEEQEGEERVGEEDGGEDEEEGEGAEGVVAPEVMRRRRRKGKGAVGRREWRESACPLLEPETTVAQSSISLPSSPTEVLGDDTAVTPNAPGRPGLSASAPLLLRRSLSFFAATASASSAGAAGDLAPSESVAQSISAAGKQWWRKKMQRFQNGAVSPVHEELEETWRLAEPHSPKKKETAGKAKKRPASDSIPPAKECKEKQNRERLLRAGGTGASPAREATAAASGGGAYHHPNAPSSTASDSPSATTSPEMSRPGSNGGRLRGRLLRARAADERGKCTSEASLTGGASELDLEFDYYDYNVQNAGAAPGSYLGMDPAFLVYIPPFEGSTSPSSNASSASTLQAPPSEGGTEALLSSSASPRPPRGDGTSSAAGGADHRGDYYCINPSYARANFQDLNGSRNGVGSEEGDGEMMSMAEFRRDSVEDEEEESEEGRGSEKETRVEKSPVEDVEDLEEDEIKFADDDEEEEDSERAKMEGEKYGVITAEGVGLKKPV